MLIVNQYKVGALSTNCYFIVDQKTRKAAIIDPGGISSDIDSAINSDNLFVEYIILTHGHFDHIRKAERYRKKTNAKIVINYNEKDFPLNSNLNLSYKFSHKEIEPFNIDIALTDGDIINLGESSIKMINTPGHTKGSSCFLSYNLLFTGDTLMKQTIGRTDLETGSSDDMANSLIKLLSLKGNYIIYPGHGETSTLDFERKSNPHLAELQYN